jgi:hypothetical protein
MDCLFEKLPVSEVHSFLANEVALIVHFSGTPPMPSTWNSPLAYPEDLRTVIHGGAMGGICCSVVRPGDNFGAGVRRACGCVGVIVGLQCKHSLVAVDPDDCGSFCNERGFREVQEPRDITVPELQRTLVERGAWNEWVVRDYNVLGIFFAAPFEVWREKAPALMEDALTSPEEITSTFPGQRIFTFGATGILQFKDGNYTPVPHLEIYK